MKRRFAISIILCLVFIMTLVFASCGKTAGEGVFTSGNNDIKFEVAAKPDGKHYKIAIVDDSFVGMEEFAYFHFQDAKGKIEFNDINAGVKIECNVDGTFYISPKDMKELLEDIFIPENASVASFVGPCEVKGLYEQDFSGYMVTFFTKFEDPFSEELIEQIQVMVCNKPLFKDGRLISPDDETEIEQILAYSGPVVEGEIFIGN